MRTPPGFSVASLRPCMISPPCRVTSAQSPWRHAPETRSKYAARFFAPPGSFQKATGMLGTGLVQTSSPAPPRSGAPLGSNTSTAMPSPGACSSPRHTGSVGLPIAKHEMISVPPLMLHRCTSRRSEEHTSELQSRLHLVCRLLLEKKKERNLHDIS